MRSPTLKDLPSPPSDKEGWPWTEESAQLPETMPGGQPWPKIAIVTPIYNQESFIEETIRSVLLQGYPNYEYIIVNDGSTDGSLRIIDKYSKWVTCITQKNAGQSAALNRGFRESTGELIGWQNSDDFYGPGNFRAGAIAAIEQPGFEIYNGTARGFWEFDFRPPWLFEVCEEFSQEAFLERMCVMNQSMLFRRAIFERGFYIREDLHYAMDIEYFWRLSIERFRFHLVPEMIGYYRQQREAKSIAHAGRGNLEAYAIFRRLCHERRLDRHLRRMIQKKLRMSLWDSLHRARRTAMKKVFAVELIMPI